MRKQLLFIAAVLFTSLWACNSAPESTPAEEIIEEEIIEEEIVEEVVNYDQELALINERRAAIEANIAEPVSISTENATAKIKQKWSNIHYYFLNNELVRIKTYPHEGISERTEEFYLENGQLILAVIEDEGSGERGKSEEAIDKMYYFMNGEVIKEVKNDEAEYGLRNSDGEELLSEMKAYVDYYEAQQ